MSEKIVLIDGHSILNRAFYGLPDLTNSEGLHTNAVYGFLNILFRTLEEEQPQYLAVAFDVHAPTFRHQMYADYKGTRKPMPSELREQVPMLKEVLRAMDIELVEKAGYEADDILGTLAERCEKEGMEVTVVSGDRDILQLASDRIMIRMPKTVRGKTTIENYHAKEVLERYQVEPKQIIELKALMGDTSDNIPGIPGVGEKTATKLIVEYGSIENAYVHVEEIRPNKAKESLKNNYDLAVMSKKLATIDTQAPVECDLEHAKIRNLYTEEAYEMFRRLDFKNLLGRFDSAAVKEQDSLFIRVETDLEEAEALLKQAAVQPAVGLELLESTAHEILGLAVAWEKDGEPEVCYIPASETVTVGFLKEKTEELFAAVEKVCVMDIKKLLKNVKNIRPEQVFDAGIAAYLLNPLKNTYTYDDLAKEYLQVYLPSTEEIFDTAKLPDLSAVSDELAGCYAGNMAYAVYRVREIMEQRLEAEGMSRLYQEIEIPLAFTLADMEEAGIRVEAEELKAYGERLQVRIGELEEKIYQEAGETFNINSPKQLGVILFEKLQLPGGRKTKSGYSTAADVLEKLAPDHPIVSDILEYRQLAKLKSTYADGLSAFIGPDGRIHSTFNQTITATGRISSTEPNLQNIPVRMELGRLIRKVFLPADGCVFIDADYSQIELRVLAHMSGDEKLIAAYRQAEDIHRITASEVFHVPFDEVTPLQRRNAKAVNFGIVYGISSFGLSQDLSISRKEAQQYIEKYFETYPGIKGFLDGCVEQAKEQGYSVTMFGRRRPVPELKSSNFMQRSFGERVAMNAPIQGTAADIIKIAMIRVNERLKREQLRARLLLQVHDELLIEAPLEEVDQVQRILEEEMTHAADLKVKLEIDMHTGNSWYEAK
ncbi:MAG: DNA polymerase I [Lacrimispora saccharolytica]|nr:DNA polymerase I [Lachnospiraceae bacterium]